MEFDVDDIDTEVEEPWETAEPVYLSAVELADGLKQLGVLKTEKAALAKQEKACNAAIADLEQRLIPTLEKAETTSQKISGVGLCIVVAKDYPSIKDFDAFKAYLEAEGNEGMIREVIPPATLAAYVKEQKTVGADLPGPEILSIFTKKSITIRKK